ncbi:AAA family ATPase [Pyrobaculum ferrireducens]|uniref:Adenylate kinase, conjectural n=1 Tax=Pyrobaculum ferrireducens TaxID=1104324 RepID=G7VD91_9CREN|nr:AAA family ATPase [Pyrobaculum ferrireducens]AET31481.1 adenylate kinase, conjectural [Pyrobaculum ferrireducens]
MADVVAVAGLPGAGKTTLARLIEKMGYSYYSLGDVVRLDAQRRGYTPDKAAVNLRLEMGRRAVVNILLKNVEPGGKIVIDGVRSLEEVEAIEEHLGPTFLIYVVASRRTRYQRLAARGRSDDPAVYSQFLLRDLRELRFGLADLLARADYIVVNEKPIEELERELRGLL